jgi:aminomethyltransferase
MANLKRTPLFEAHQKLGARLIDFGGWEMPVQYTGIIDEHNAVRTAGGVFDISHMGEVFVRGAQAAEFLNSILTNDIKKLSVGQAQYTLMCNERGGVVDDLYAYRIADHDYLLIINASRIDADVPWMERQLSASPFKGGCSLENVSDRYAAVAIQGPRVQEIIDSIVAGASQAPSSLKKNEITFASLPEGQAFIARTGYTGEDGFEIVAPAEAIEGIWNRTLELGKSIGLKPAGLGARDTLRTEVCYPLYGHELSEDITPIEAGVGFFVALDKPSFVGREVLAKQKAEGVSRRCVAFTMKDKGAPPRPGYAIFAPDGVKIGDVVSGTLSPSLNNGIGLGYVPLESAKQGTMIDIEIRGRRYPAQIVPKPIYRKAV